MEKISLGIRPKVTHPVYIQNQSGYKVTYFILENLCFSKITLMIGRDGQVTSELIEDIYKIPL